MGRSFSCRRLPRTRRTIAGRREPVEFRHDPPGAFGKLQPGGPVGRCLLQPQGDGASDAALCGRLDRQCRRAAPHCFPFNWRIRIPEHAAPGRKSRSLRDAAVQAHGLAGKRACAAGYLRPILPAGVREAQPRGDRDAGRAAALGWPAVLAGAASAPAGISRGIAGALPGALSFGVVPVGCPQRAARHRGAPGKTVAGLGGCFTSP